MTEIRTLPAHENCNHTKYWLTCEQYEQILDKSGNQCQACGRPASDCEPHQKLYIDHDYDYGVWAVRGILCPRCNGMFVQGKAVPDWAEAYFRDPWFKQAFAAMDVPIDPQPEPPVGSWFRSPSGTTWRRNHQRWQNESFARAWRDWRGMCRDFSPLHLREIHVPKPSQVSEHVWLYPNNPEAVAELLRTHMPEKHLDALVRMLQTS
jgi:Recombination endonuclease VII